MNRVIVQLPYHLRTLASVEGDVELSFDGTVTPRTVIDNLEARFPVLRGTVREHVSHKRRPWIRYFACSEDWTFESEDKPLPDTVANGAEPFLVVGAIAGG
jgi:molybdopterin synthase sulfur carrier subunit